MTTYLSLLTISEPALTAVTKRSDAGWIVYFRGTADLRIGGALQQFLHLLHEKALEHTIKEIKIDFAALEFMNSSCFKSFVTMLTQLQELPKEKQYTVHFQSNPSMLWQRRSLEALKCFAEGLVFIDSTP